MKKIGIVEAHRQLLAKVREKKNPWAAISLLEAFARKKKGGRNV